MNKLPATGGYPQSRASLRHRSRWVFLIGITLLYVFYFKLRLLPPPAYTPLTENPVAWAQGLFLAWLTVALGLAALYACLTRTGVLEVQGED
jgi:peptide/nickel transport system permease protein